MNSPSDANAAIRQPSPEEVRENRRRANRALLKSFEALWDEYPEQRFGQLVKNLSRGPTPSGFEDIWGWKNADWSERITKMFWEGRRA